MDFNHFLTSYMPDPKIGSKLHFEVWGKGQKLDPEKWLIKK